MACKLPDITYCCEICGLENLTEEELRIHTSKEHVDGQGVCPFCQLSANSHKELLLHVNQAHLDFLTPDSEVHNISFIDDASPSECNDCFKNGDAHDHWNTSVLNSFSNQKSSGHINNINVNASKTNLVNGDVSPNKSTHYGEGSPLRHSLNLKLQNSIPAIQQCLMCTYTSSNPEELQEHINRKHFDLFSPSPVFECPLCDKKCLSTRDLELHVNIEHQDILSPANKSESQKSVCPFCNILLDNTNGLADTHVETHFTAGSPLQMDKDREQREFEMLQAQYGMDNQGNYRDQSVSNMQRAVYAGEMSVSDFYERTLDLKASESCGIDDGNSVTRALVPRVRAVCNNSSTVVRMLSCTCVDHYASSFGDRGWGCGYRNAQMLISSLLNHTGYNERLYKLWHDQKPTRSAVPSISRLQTLIEEAWSQGFDLQGSEQLGCRLINTRKWIGATEVVTLLSFLRIRCQLIDFHRPTGAGHTHPDLFKWVLKYYESIVGGEFAPPLYLQHQGHSRTIMGVEVHKDGKITLLVLDPSHSPQQMAQLGDTTNGLTAIRLLRKDQSAMKARQYQIVAVVGTMDSEHQYQQSKVLRGLRIPDDR